MFAKKRGNILENKTWIAVATLIGTIIGAGILAMPYVVAKSGFLIGFVLIIVLGLIYLLINLYVGEIILRTKGYHQLVGYMEKYLGKWAKHLMAFSMIFALYGALTAYLIGEGEVLSRIFGFDSPLIFSLIFFLVFSYIIYRGLRAMGEAELILVFLMVVVITLIAIFSFNRIDLSYLQGYDFKQILFPYGVIIFAYFGFTAIPEMHEELGRERKKLKKAIIIGSLIPIVVYLIFCGAVVGVVGKENFELLQPNERIATIALGFYTSKFFSVIINLLAFFTMGTGFLALGVALKEMFQFDYQVKKNISLFLVLIVPLIITVLKLTTFISIINFVGGIAGGIIGILIILCFIKCKEKGERKPEFSVRRMYLIEALLILMFISGIIYELT